MATVNNLYNSTTNLKDIVLMYRESYSDACLRRTAPKPELPRSFELWLRAVDLATTPKKPRVKAKEVSGIYASVEKVSDSIYHNLCRMTAEPFPFISSGTALEENGNTAVQKPLVDPQTGFKTAERYARLYLSELGKYAVKHYKGVKMSDIKTHRSLIPLNLLRTTTPWSLGYKTEFRSLNPSELFQLMIMMIDKGTPDLSDDEVGLVFKGCDVGHGYRIYQTNASLMSLYAAGVGSITVVPEVEIDRANNRIVIKKPPLDSTTNRIKKYYGEIILKYLEGFLPNERSLDNPLILNDTNRPFKSFLPKSVAASGSSLYLQDVDFYPGATDDDIKEELWSDNMLQKSIRLTNSVLIDKDDKVDNSAHINPNIGIYDEVDYRIDVLSVKDTLWNHIWYEFNIRVQEIKNDIEALKQDLKLALLLEKVTRPKIAEYIHSIQMHANTRSGELISMLGVDSTSELKTEYLPEGFTVEEVNLIWAERSSIELNGSRINILAILPKRDAYKNEWEFYKNQIQELENMLKDNRIIFNAIRDDLVYLANHPEHQRQSLALFTDGKFKNEEGLNSFFSFKPEWESLNIPVSLYYNNDYLFKSYGKNMNTLRDVEDSKQIPYRVLNCTTKDYIGFVRNGETIFYKISDLQSDGIRISDMNGIIPFSPDKRLIVITAETVIDSKTGQKIPVQSHYYVTPPMAGLNELKFSGMKPTEMIMTFAYLDNDNEYLDFNCLGIRYNYEVFKDHGVFRIKKTSLDLEIDKKHLIPPKFGIIYDILERKDKDSTMEVLFTGYKDTWDLKTSLEIDSFARDATPTNLECLLGFTSHIEMYAGNQFLSHWVDNFIVTESSVTHGKKAFLPENTWVFYKDANSKKVRQRITDAILSKSVKPTYIISNATENYLNYDILQLEDWSIIDPRYGVPSIKPKQEEALRFINDYMNRKFLCQLSNKEGTAIREMDALLIDYKDDTNSEEIKSVLDDTILPTDTQTLDSFGDDIIYEHESKNLESDNNAEGQDTELENSSIDDSELDDSLEQEETINDSVMGTTDIE